MTTSTTKKPTPRQLHRLGALEVKGKRKPGYYADGGGLYLQVSRSGSKSWLFRFTRKGRAREMGLGSLSTISLSQARDKALECRQLLDAGIDPIEARGAAQTAATLAGLRSKTFKECAEAFIEANRAEWKNAKHAAQWENTLETYAYPAFGDLPVSVINTGHVLKAIEPIWQSKRETASRLRGRIEKILDWATVRGYREGLNPARWRGHLDHTLPKQSRSKKIQHHPALVIAKLPAFMKELRALDGTAPKALELIILTATRTNEALGAQWAEFDLEARTWTVPAERMKAKIAHKVPLSDAAMQILEEMKPVATGTYAFPSSRGDQPLSNMACLAVLKRMKRENITVHGFRSTFRDWASEKTTFQREVIEMSLAHAIGDKVEAAYRRGDLFEKRRRLMDAWAEYCAKEPLPESATVHAITEKKKHAKK